MGKDTQISRERCVMLESIYDSAPSAILEIELEPQLRILRHNRTARELSGLGDSFTLEELAELMDADDFKRGKGVCHKVMLTGSTAKLECRLVRTDGALRFFNCFISKQETNDDRAIVVCVARDDTELHDSVELMRQNYLRYKMFTEMKSVDVLEIDFINSRVLFGSNRFAGYDVCNEMSLEQVEKLDWLYADDMNDYLAVLDRSRRTNEKAGMQLRLNHADGSVKWHKATFQPVANEQSVVIRMVIVVESVDTTSEMQDLMASVLEMDHDALLLVDSSNWTYRKFTRSGMTASISIGGKNTGEVLSDFAREVIKSYNLVIPPDYDFFNKLKITRVRSALERDGAFTMVCPLIVDGETHFKRLHVQNYDQLNTVFLVVVTDVTTETLEERRKQEQLESALCEAEQAAQAKQDFLSNMSHEIRTPLNGIKGMLDLLHQRSELRDDTYVKNALNATDHLTALINDILDMSRIDSGKVELKPIAVSCAELLDYIDLIIAPMAQEKGINFLIETDYRGCEYIMVDAGRIKQVMLNILTNAVKYTNYGGRIRSVFKLERLEDDRAKLHFSVTDNGIGMSREFLKRAFEPFEQEKQDGSRPGTGLGLAITRRLINLMHGSISIDSEQGVGTRIVVELETDTATENDLEKRSTAAKEPKTLLLNKKRAIIVEDNELNMEIADIQIKSFGLKTERAFDGQQAVDKFMQSKPFYYDIIFMDIMMPNKDGLEATKEIRAADRPDAKSIKIIAMTANAFIEDIHKSRESGMDMHLSKPFDRKDLAAVLSSAFGGQPAEAAD